MIFRSTCSCNTIVRRIQFEMSLDQNMLLCCYIFVEWNISLYINQNVIDDLFDSGKSNISLDYAMLYAVDESDRSKYGNERFESFDINSSFHQRDKSMKHVHDAWNMMHIRRNNVQNPFIADKLERLVSFRHNQINFECSFRCLFFCYHTCWNIHCHLSISGKQRWNCIHSYYTDVFDANV